MPDELCLQERYAPHNACFGCGPANEKGLQVGSIPDGDEVVATWSPEPHHEAFPGVMNGGTRQSAVQHPRLSAMPRSSTGFQYTPWSPRSRARPRR